MAVLFLNAQMVIRYLEAQGFEMAGGGPSLMIFTRFKEPMADVSLSNHSNILLDEEVKKEFQNAGLSFQDFLKEYPEAYYQAEK